MLNKVFNLFKPANWAITTSSEVGPHRDHNEDYVLVKNDKNIKLAILCDGVGGNNAGEVASKLCCEELSNHIMARKGRLSNQSDLKKIIQATHNTVVKQGEGNPAQQGMATTLVAYIQVGKQGWIVWAGDSRAYLIDHNQTLTQISQDHSFVNEKVLQGVLSEEEALNHPMASMITSSVGGTSKSLRHIGIKKVSPKKGNTLILVSDGVYGFISAQQIINGAQGSAHAITELAIKADTSDNCSAIVINLQ